MRYLYPLFAAFVLTIVGCGGGGGGATSVPAANEYDQFAAENPEINDNDSGDEDPNATE